MKFPWNIASRYLWSKRSEAFITIITLISILGVAVGVIVINITMSIMSGFEHELREKIVGTDSHIVLRHLSGKIQNWEELVPKVASISGVESAAPFTYNQALIRGERSSAGVLIRGVAPGSSAAKQLEIYLEDKNDLETLFQPQKFQGGFDEETRLDGIIVGQELLRQMGFLVGQPIALLSPQVSSTPLGLVPRFKRYIITGFYESGLVQYESGLAYMGIKAAQQFFQLGNSVSGLDIRVVDIEKAPELATVVLDQVGGLQSGFYAQDWTEINKPLWDALKLEKTVYFIVLLLIIVMASFSIVSTLVLLVMEKRSDIAVLRTLGATARDVANIFRYQGAIIGVLGTTTGLLGGYLGCILLREYGFPIDERVFGMAAVPVRILPVNFAISGLTAFIICLLATLYPARKASALDPAQVLRYE